MSHPSPMTVILLAFMGGAFVWGGMFPYGKNVPRWAMFCCGITIASLAVTLGYSR